MTFAVAADAYDRFMGRYASRLAPGFADFAGVRPGDRALDVGCGPGALTAELVRRVGSERVAAVDPSEPFVEAARTRHPGVDVRQAVAEALPFEDGSFDTSLAQLVVHFMQDPAAGLREMARVTRRGGLVAAAVWDFGGDRAPISAFWQAAHELDAEAPGEAHLAGAHAGHLAELFAAAGLHDVEEETVSTSVEHATFADWWEPFTLGVGPAGAYAQSLTERERDRLRERARALLPEAPFTVIAHAWAARGTV